MHVFSLDFTSLDSIGNKTQRLLGVFAFCFSASLFAFSVEQHLNDATLALQQHQAGAAAIEVKSVLAQYPQHAEALVLLGKVYLQQHEYKAAIATLQAARKFGAQWGSWVLSLGQSYLSAKQYALLLNEIYVIDPDLVDADLAGQITLLRGHAAYGLGQWSIAKESYERYLAKNPNKIEGMVALSRALEHLGDVEAAQTLQKRAEQQNPEHAAVLTLQAEQAFHSKETAEASSLVERAIVQKDAPSQAWILRANLARLEKNWPKFHESVASLIEKKVEHPRAQFLFALDAYVQGDFKRARDALRTARVDDEMDLLSAKIDFMNKNYTDAYETLTLIQQKDPFVDTLKATIALIKRDPHTVLEINQHTKTLTPLQTLQQASAYELLGKRETSESIFAHVNVSHEAFEALLHAFVQTEFPMQHTGIALLTRDMTLSLAKGLWQKGAYNEALELAKQATVWIPQDGDLLQLLGGIQLALKEKEALKTFRHLVDIRPNSKAAWRYYAQAEQVLSQVQ